MFGIVKNTDQETVVAEPAESNVIDGAADAPEKLYSFRKLNSTDLFPMIKIIGKIGIDELTQVLDGDVIKNLISKTDDGEEKNEEKGQFIVGVGIALKLANKILEHLPSCEQEIYTLLASVSGKTVDDIKTQDLDVFIEMIVDFVQKEEFRSFFKVASKFIK